jgi:hypothetical protein
MYILHQINFLIQPLLQKLQSMKKFFAVSFSILVLMLFFFQDGQAQQVKQTRPNYKNAIGVKFTPFAVTYKNFFRARNRAFELLGDFDGGFRLTGLYEFHGNLNGPGNLKWYIGGGGHAGYLDRSDASGIMLGVDGVVGLDFKFPRAPLNIALDWQPAYEFITPSFDFQGDRGGIAVRFAF